MADALTLTCPKGGTVGGTGGARTLTIPIYGEILQLMVNYTEGDEDGVALTIEVLDNGFDPVNYYPLCNVNAADTTVDAVTILYDDTSKSVINLTLPCVSMDGVSSVKLTFTPTGSTDATGSVVAYARTVVAQRIA